MGVIKKIYPTFISILKKAKGMSVLVGSWQIRIWFEVFIPILVVNKPILSISSCLSLSPC